MEKLVICFNVYRFNFVGNLPQNDHKVRNQLSGACVMKRTIKEFPYG